MDDLLVLLAERLDGASLTESCRAALARGECERLEFRREAILDVLADVLAEVLSEELVIVPLEKS